MAYEMKEGQITIFWDRKKKGDKYPDLKGTMMFEGKEIKFALWEKNSAKAGQYFTGKVDRMSGFVPPQNDEDIRF